MKTILVSLGAVISFLLMSASGALAQDFKPALVVQAPENVFAPMGFDDNDNSQLVLYGNLTDTCHKAGPVRYKVDTEHKVIYVRNEVYYYSGCWCAEVLVPFTQTVNLGVVQQGSYDVVVEMPDGSFRKMARLPIAAATTASPDDYLYAPVDHVHLNRGHGSTPSEVVLEGTFRNSCMHVKEVKVTYRAGNGNPVVEIQPIAELGSGSDCSNESRPFRTKVELKDSLHGRALIHVRSLNGQALNQVVEL